MMSEYESCEILLYTFSEITNFKVTYISNLVNLIPSETSVASTVHSAVKYTIIST
jgi:hypothetical protein